jgi:predicted PurR-regulated permease PerM
VEHPQPEPAGRFRSFLVFVTLVLVVAVLYWGRVVFLPVALATLMAFVLSPLVGLLQRRGLGRVAAALLVTALVFSALGGAGWVISRQLTAVLHDLPGYTEKIKGRIADMRRAGRDSALDRARGAVDEVVGELEKEEAGRPGAERRPVPVVVQEESGSLLASLPALVHQVAAAGLVLLLAVFILLERQELRNRLIRLLGYGRLTLTTRALDEAGQRISRYLLTQSALNGALGAAFALGLLLIGVPYALLWGVVLALARFVPFVGVWPAVLLPTALSLALFEGWLRPVLVLAVFLVLELLLAAVIEPVVFSHRIGVSRVALLVALGFWTWLWGAPGLVLAMPLTVCLVVLARHIPEMEFLAILLGDEPALETSRSYYQRLLALDPDEAAEIVEERLAGEGEPLARVYDEVVIAGLIHARTDRARGRIGEEDEGAIVAATGDIVAEVPARLPPGAGAAPPGGGLPAVRILGIPLRDAADAVALQMFRQVLDSRLCTLEVLGPGLLAAEVMERVAEERPVLLCLAALPPGGTARARYLLKRLRARFPELRILVGRWGTRGTMDEDRRVLAEAGATQVAATLGESRDQVLALLPVLSAVEPVAEPVAMALQPSS